MTISTNTEALNATALATRAIHAGQEPDPTTGAVVTPIYMTSTFKQDGVGGLRNGYDYSRSINPTRNSFDEQLAAVEGANYALSFASGLAAIDVLLRATLKPGDNILLGNDVYGGTYRLLSKVFVPWGIGLGVVDITDTAAVSVALSQKQYRYIWVETPSNPLLNITDIAATSAVAPKWWWTTPSHPRYCSIRCRMAPTWSYIPPPNTSAAIPTWSAERWCSTTGKSAMKWRSCRTRPELCHLRSTPGLTFVASKRWICASSSTVVTP